MSTALLVIDAQKIYTDLPESEMHCQDAKATLKRINELIEAFQAQKRSIIFIRHVHKADGSDTGRLFEGEEEFDFVEDTEDVDYSAALTKPDRAPEIIKNRYSAFVGTDLHNRLKKLDVDTVAICGFMTNFCCESTARDALDLDYLVDFVVDATGTPGTDNLDEKKVREVVGELLGAGIARVVTTKEYVAQQTAQR